MVLFLFFAIFLLVITVVMPEGMTSIPVLSRYPGNYTNVHRKGDFSQINTSVHYYKVHTNADASNVSTTSLLRSRVRSRRN
ncbi:hypothetical protein DPMN_166126 [Dreissena polymorpha]|uniref:Uncharacterized protein n=1 Tax=Dreissena polymorpha TaxID=45954 RepID=A0A9D4IXL8_DREPO|nr:hypothetical protein DPMN_166126 [Dreissena polymorpha]